MLKKVAKTVLRSPRIQKRLTAFYCGQQGLSRSTIEACLADGQIWYFSQMKTGTTFLCNALAFYNAQLHGICDVNFGNIQDGGIGRAVGHNAEVLEGILGYQRLTQSSILVHSHRDLADCKPAFFMCSTRNPLDYAVSSYYYFFRNRHHKSDVSVEDALPRIVDRFCATHIAQRSAAQRSDNVIKVRYEGLMTSNEQVLSNVIRQLYGTCDADALAGALERASVQNLKRYEAEQGYAQIAAKGTFKEPHFVRSGKIGEGREFFTDRQIDLIQKRLIAAGVPSDGSFDF